MIYRLLGLVVLAYFFLSLTGLRRRRAVASRVLAVYQLILLFIILAFLFPDASNRAAHFVGITRGADFGIYSLSLFFLFLSFRLVQVSRASQESTQRLVREIALQQAVLLRRRGS